MHSCDVAVVGLGAMGAATLWALARQGVPAIGIDRFAPPHDQGSTLGQTRITRLAVGEGADYVPLARRSHEVWRALEAATGADLLTQCGGLIVGAPGGGAVHGAADFVGATIAIARAHGIDHEVLTGAALSARFPQLRFQPDDVGYLEPEAGFLRPEACITALLAQARRLGADIRTGQQVQSLTPDATGVTLALPGGPIRAGKVVLTAGAWIPGFLPPAARSHFTVCRNVLHWLPVADKAAFSPANCPVYIRVARDGFYGFPDVDGSGTLKIGGENLSRPTDPDQVNRAIAEDEWQEVLAMAGPFIPGLSGPPARSTTCLYTMTPDCRAIIDRHPDSGHVLVCSPCSGHGFKHSAAIGELMAELATKGRTRFDISGFGLSRFY